VRVSVISDVIEEPPNHSDGSAARDSRARCFRAAGERDTVVDDKPVTRAAVDADAVAGVDAGVGIVLYSQPLVPVPREEVTERMPTLVQFVDRDSIIVDEDFETVYGALVLDGAALVHRSGSESRVAVLASNITYVEEYEGGRPMLA
jgi:hypothetical protein